MSISDIWQLVLSWFAMRSGESSQAAADKQAAELVAAKEQAHEAREIAAAVVDFARDKSGTVGVLRRGEF